MTDISTALTELGITEWVMRGEPTTEAEFNEMFRKVTGADENGSLMKAVTLATLAQLGRRQAKRTELVNAEPMRLLHVKNVTVDIT